MTRHRLNLSSVGLESFVKVNITVKDINDNKPELVADEVFLCENDMAGTVIKKNDRNRIIGTRAFLSMYLNHRKPFDPRRKKSESLVFSHSQHKNISTPLSSGLNLKTSIVRSSLSIAGSCGGTVHFLRSLTISLKKL